ncbi:Isochorismatase-like protein [Mycena floridula]|nr:Isochorismatase-like protein [Mycena floridula]
MTTNRALVIIDLQNEFLSSQGRFPVLGSSGDSLLQNLVLIVPKFRQSGGKIIWIRSIYAYTPSEPVRGLRTTHTGDTPCCEAGSWNSEFHPLVLSLQQESDLIVLKSNYSAFEETVLQQTLETFGITDVYFCGLLSGTCVLASVVDAVQMPFKVFAISDCLGYRREQSHNYALGRMGDLLVNLVTTDQAVSMAPPPTRAIPVLYYVNGSIPSWRVQIALNEKKIAVHQIRMKVMTQPKPTRLPAFLEQNHRGKTPVFVDTDPEGTTVNESLALLMYLETYYPQTPLLPPVEQRKYRARIMSLVQETENLHIAFDALEEGYFEARDARVLSNFKISHQPSLVQALYHELEFWEKYASESTQFIGGAEEFTLADCAFYPLLGYLLRRGFRFGEEWPGLERYHEAVSLREAVQLAQPEGWVGPGRLDLFA